MDVAGAFRLRGLAIISLSFPLVALSACGLNNTITNDSQVQADSCATTAVPNSFIVKWKSGAITQENAENREALERDLIRPNKSEIDYAENDHTIHVAPVPILRDATVTAPSAVATNWGQTKVSAQAAWSQNLFGDGVIVAVVDSGADITQPQLKNQLAINPNEVVNGVDDDSNGYIDDVNGWDFSTIDPSNPTYRGSPNVTDGAGHGTHVSGIILADPAAGPVQGLAQKAKLLPLRFMDANGDGLVSNAVLAINFAVARGAKIINASWGGGGCTKSLQQAIANAGSKGVMFISASGNGDSYGRGLDLDTNPVYPAAYGISSQITVGSANSSDVMSGFSNFSPVLVNLLAPGEQIYSTWPGGITAILDGTSMATPFVSGAAAILWSYRPKATLNQVRTALLSSVDGFGYPASSGGRLNIASALTALGQVVQP